MEVNEERLNKQIDHMNALIQKHGHLPAEVASSVMNDWVQLIRQLAEHANRLEAQLHTGSLEMGSEGLQLKTYKSKYQRLKNKLSELIKVQGELEELASKADIETDVGFSQKSDLAQRIEAATREIVQRSK